MKIITRKEAKAKGLSRYFTGKACVHGHIAERYTCNKTCVECEAIRKQKARSTAKEVKTETKIEVVSVPKRQVRIVKFKVIGNGSRFGRGKFDNRIIEDKIVNL